jgi:biopolymer transport protein ExbB/TolQ
MGRYIFLSSTLLSILTLVFLVNPSEASAYVGPGPGLSFITTLIGFVVAIFTSLFVIVFYPIRKYLKRKKQNTTEVQPVMSQTSDQENIPPDNKKVQ